MKGREAVCVDVNVLRSVFYESTECSGQLDWKSCDGMSLHGTNKRGSFAESLSRTMDYTALTSHFHHPHQLHSPSSGHENKTSISH